MARAREARASLHSVRIYGYLERAGCVQSGLARVGRLGLNRTPGPLLLAAAVGVPGLKELGSERACVAGENAPALSPRPHRLQRAGRSSGIPEPAPSGVGADSPKAPGFTGRPVAQARGRSGARSGAAQAHAAPPVPFTLRGPEATKPGGVQRQGARRRPLAASFRKWEAAQHPGGSSQRSGAAGPDLQPRETEYPPAGRECRNWELVTPPLLQSKNHLLLKL